MIQIWDEKDRTILVKGVRPMLHFLKEKQFKEISSLYLVSAKTTQSG